MSILTKNALGLFYLDSNKRKLILNHGGGKSQPKFHYCWCQYICDGINKTPEQERPIGTNLEETTIQPDSSLKNQFQSNAVKANLTKVNPNYGRPEYLQDFYNQNVPKISMEITNNFSYIIKMKK